MSDPAGKHPLSIWQDDNGDFSMGRLMIFIGCMVGGFIAVTGAILAVIEVIVQSRITAGVALAGIGAGLFGTSVAVHGWQRSSESGAEGKGR